MRSKHLHRKLYRNIERSLSRYVATRGAPVAAQAQTICLPGHGRGVDDIVGIDKDGKQRRRYGGYQNDFALQCVEHGLAAFAIEQLGIGHRRDDAARKGSPERPSCQPAAGAALMLGETMAGWTNGIMNSSIVIHQN